MKKKVLRLILKRKWYNLIAIGAKREEYREIKEYWLKRLFDVQSPMIAKDGNTNDGVRKAQQWLDIALQS